MKLKGRVRKLTQRRAHTKSKSRLPKQTKKYRKKLLKKKTIKKRKVFKGGEPNNDDCPICLEKISSGKTTTIECNHNFHADCLHKWCHNKDKAKCPMCRGNISKTCEQIRPFDSKDIFKYTLIGGADDKSREKSIEMVRKFIDNPRFDVNVVNPDTNKSILFELTKYPYAFYDSIQKLLQNPDLKVQANVISLLVSSNLTSDERIKKLYNQNKQVKKMLRSFI